MRKYVKWVCVIYFALAVMGLGALDGFTVGWDTVGLALGDLMVLGWLVFSR